MPRTPLVAAPTSLVVRTDADGRALWVGASCAELTGWCAQSLAGRAVWDFHAPPDIDAAAVATMRDALASGRACSGVVVDNVRPDGSRYRVRIDLEPEPDAAGHPAGWVALRSIVPPHASGADPGPHGDPPAVGPREEALLRAFDLVHVALVQRDLPDGPLLFNGAAAELFGLGRCGPVDVAVLPSLFHPDDHDAVQADVRRALDRPGLVTESTYRVLPPGRPMRHVRARRTVVPAVGGRPAQLMVVLLDETERHRKAQRERDLALDHAQALDLAGLGTWRLLSWDGLVELDERLLRVFGLPPGFNRLAWTDWLGLVHPDDRALLMAASERSRRSAQGTTVTRLRIVRADGEVRWLQAMYRHQDPASGAVLVGTTQDITEREQALRRLRVLFDQALNGIALLADDARVIDANPQAVRMYGGAREQLLGRDLAELVEPGAGGPAVLAANWSAFLAAGRTQGLAWLRPAVGAPVAADFVGVANIEPGVHLMLLSDATQRLRAERQLRELAARQRDDFDALRAELARDVHDQLGQTLGALMFEIGMHGRRTGTDVSALKSLLDDAVATTRGLTRALHPASLELGLVSALNGLAGDVSRRTDIDVRVQAPSTLPALPEPVVRAIYRIAQEALTNVVKHAGADTADVLLEVAPAAPGTPAGELVVCIVDTGRGFQPRRRRARAADPGLGLVGMRERARQIGARLDIHSRPGAGCRIILRLALDPAARAAQAGAPSTMRPSRSA